MIGELLGRAGRIAGVKTFAARTGRMENADIEQCLGCCRIFARQIFGDVRAGEAPPMDRDPDIIETMCGGLGLWKDMDIAGKGQLVGKTIGRSWFPRTMNTEMPASSSRRIPSMK